jgi:hypothetical protein
VRGARDMVQLIGNTEHWRKRAKEARTIAVDITDPEGRRLMLGIAEAYDDLAVRAEARRGLWLVAGSVAGTNSGL